MEREYFSKQEALEKVGKLIETLVAFSGVPKGTSGTVIGIYEAGWSENKESYGLDIQWHLDPPKPLVAEGKAAGEPFLFIQSGKARTDGFSKNEYEKYLKELSN